MKIGSIVESTSNFDNVRNVWTEYVYPVKEQILTIKTMVPHPKWNEDDTFKFYLLTFEEMETYPLAHMNFKELQPPMDLSKLMAETEAITHTNIEPHDKKETHRTD